LSELTIASDADLEECLAFLQESEYRCAGLTSRLKKKDRAVLPEASEGTLWVLRDREKRNLRALYLKTPSGMVFHCACEGLDPSEPKAAGVLSLLGKDSFAIVGSAAHGSVLESLAARSPRHTVDYELMTLEQTRGSPGNPAEGSAYPGIEGPGFPKVEIARALVSDAEELFHLQKGYEREEVLLPGEAFSPDRCRAQLRVTLAQQVVFVLRSGNAPAAKAGTNARGFAWDQIGGVYTLPGLRNRGFATAVVGALIDNRLREGRNLALFVKTANISAQKVYEKLGFRYRDRFRISYW